MTGISGALFDLNEFSCCTKVEALTRSKWVIPYTLASMFVFALCGLFAKVDTISGTNEFTGFEMTNTCTLDKSQYSAMSFPSDLMILALTPIRSSRDIPGFLGTPAGMMTMSASCKHRAIPPFPSFG